MMKSAVVRYLIAVCVIAGTGCARAGEDARRDHILAADHGWIDLTLKAPALPPAGDGGTTCHVGYSFNGEQLLSATADLATAEANKNLVGYRFPAPVGTLQTELIISQCVKTDLVVKLPLALQKDHLAELEFDGTTMVLKSSVPYEPTSLEWVRTEILQLQSENGASSQAVSTLTKIALASLALNFLALLLIVWRWRAKSS